jgi:hypothetical protein
LGSGRKGYPKNDKSSIQKIRLNATINKRFFI